jgi:uncharacterized protein (UPF0332 family)
MALEDLLKERVIYKIRPDSRVALRLLERAKNDVATADRLLHAEDYDWAITIYYNSMLRSARALMSDIGYRPSSVNGHMAVIRFLRERQKGDEWDTVITELDRLRRKRHELVYEEPEEAAKEDAFNAKDWAGKFLALTVVELSRKRR